VTAELTPRVIIPVKVADRSEMVNQMFDAATALGVERHEIRTASEGFNVPRAVAHYLFPSTIPQG
jgi:hypothetical protein